LRVGFTDLTPAHETRARSFVARLAAATGARAEIGRAPMEVQLGLLEDGELDLVVGEFRPDTPWASTVTIVEPLETYSVGSRVFELAPAAAYGENRWIALVEREVRDSRAERRR